MALGWRDQDQGYDLNEADGINNDEGGTGFLIRNTRTSMSGTEYLDGVFVRGSCIREGVSILVEFSISDLLSLPLSLISPVSRLPFSSQSTANHPAACQSAHLQSISCSPRTRTSNHDDGRLNE